MRSMERCHWRSKVWPSPRYLTNVTSLPAALSALTVASDQRIGQVCEPARQNSGESAGSPYVGVIRQLIRDLLPTVDKTASSCRQPSSAPPRRSRRHQRKCPICSLPFSRAVMYKDRLVIRSKYGRAKASILTSLSWTQRSPHRLSDRAVGTTKERLTSASPPYLMASGVESRRLVGAAQPRCLC
jgi:hypothetical protein